MGSTWRRLSRHGLKPKGRLVDLASGRSHPAGRVLAVAASSFHWLTET